MSSVAKAVNKGTGKNMKDAFDNFILYLTIKKYSFILTDN